jgi:hypothetical protein
MKVRVFWAWYDFYVGWYWSTKKRTLYLVLIPTVVIALEFGQ